MFARKFHQFLAVAAAAVATFLSAPAHAAIMLVDTGFGFSSPSNGSTSSLSRVGNVYTHSFDAGASFDMLVVTVSREASELLGEAFDVTYGGIAMNLATGTTAGSGVSIFYLDTNASSGNVVADFTGFSAINGVGIAIAAIESDNGDPIGLFDAGTGTGTSISIDTADNSFTMWAVDTNLGSFSNLPPTQIVKNEDIGSNGYAAAYELVATGVVGDTYSYTNTNFPRGIAAANFVVVPEPTTVALLGVAAAGGLLAVRRRRG
jgi:hypothetical protein